MGNSYKGNRESERKIDKGKEGSSYKDGSSRLLEEQCFLLLKLGWMSKIRKNKTR